MLINYLRFKESFTRYTGLPSWFPIPTRTKHPAMILPKNGMCTHLIKKEKFKKIYHMFSLKMIRSKCKNSSESSDVNHLLRKETFLFNKQIHLGLWLITDLSSLCLEILILSRSSIVLTLRGSSSACLKHNKNNQSRGQKQGYFTWMCSWFSEFDS